VPGRILVVDDHPMMRMYIKKRLEWEQGFEVCGEAENGRDAVEKAQHLRPDAIVLDLSMPVMNGLEAARLLRRLLPNVPILMYTSHTTANLDAEALAAGASAVLEKGKPIDELVTGLQQLVRRAA
jgi:DNA-binding NarL/FixJ family response regulator